MRFFVIAYKFFILWKEGEASFSVASKAAWIAIKCGFLEEIANIKVGNF